MSHAKLCLHRGLLLALCLLCWTGDCGMQQEEEQEGWYVVAANTSLFQHANMCLPFLTLCLYTLWHCCACFFVGFTAVHATSTRTAQAHLISLGSKTPAIPGSAGWVLGRIFPSPANDSERRT